MKITAIITVSSCVAAGAAFGGYKLVKHFRGNPLQAVPIIDGSINEVEEIAAF